MANQNLKSGQDEALKHPNLTVEFITGKNPKNALKTIVNGVQFTTTTIGSKADWAEFFNQFVNGVKPTSMAKSKSEHGHGYNAIIRQVHKLEQNMTYVKNDRYNFEKLSMPRLIKYILEDYAYSLDLLKSLETFTINDLKNLIEFNGNFYEPMTVKNVVDEWFTVHENFKEYKNLSVIELFNRYENMQAFI